ncbi:MAG: hypothetical protein JRI55_25290, partial [Deltaproteobacteria bacterium]|nr:hypothetical protein [Deltaproteobacteria bacterium]
MLTATRISCAVTVACVCVALMAGTSCSDDKVPAAPADGGSGGASQGGFHEGGGGAGGQASTSPELLMPEFDLPTIEADLRYLASNECSGRATATAGNELALAYVEQRFADIGLEPAGDAPKSYRQEFPYAKYEQTAPPVVTFDGATLVSGDDYTVVMYSSPGQIDAEVVFVGYGLTVP